MKRLIRNKRGNMLALTVCCTFLIVVVVTQMSSFGALLFAHQKLEDQTEAIELRAVEVLNSGDRSGRINLMTSASRELVFDSRRIFNGVAQNSPGYMGLAEFYLEQSREGAQLVAKERQQIIDCTLAEERALAADINKTNQHKKLLPWASTEGATMYDFDLGYSKCEDSNVVASEYDPDLYEFDEQNKSFSRDTKLYHGNVSLKLPGPDDDLNFRLSSLPAPVGSTTSPARIDQGDNFVATRPLIYNGEVALGSCEYVPSRAKLTLAEKFSNEVGVACHQRICASASGSTNGAGAPAI